MNLSLLVMSITCGDIGTETIIFNIGQKIIKWTVCTQMSASKHASKLNNAQHTEQSLSITRDCRVNRHALDTYWLCCMLCVVFWRTHCMQNVYFIIFLPFSTLIFKKNSLIFVLTSTSAIPIATPAIMATLSIRRSLNWSLQPCENRRHGNIHYSSNRYILKFQF